MRFLSSGVQHWQLGAGLIAGSLMSAFHPFLPWQLSTHCGHYERAPSYSATGSIIEQMMEGPERHDRKARAGDTQTASNTPSRRCAKAGKFARARWRRGRKRVGRDDKAQHRSAWRLKATEGLARSTMRGTFIGVRPSLQHAA